MAELLALERLSAGYGEARVLNEVSLAIQDGRSLALLGRNGAGKAPGPGGATSTAATG